MPKDNEVDEKVIWIDDLAAVLEAAGDASAVPLTWLANREFSPEQTKAWLCDTVDNTVEDGAFSGELHSIAEEESGLIVAFTGCGPKSAANAKFLIWCAHFILKHRDSLSDHAATVAELRAEVERLQDALDSCREAGNKHVQRRCQMDDEIERLTGEKTAAERRVGELEAKARNWDDLIAARAETARDPDDAEWKMLARQGRKIEAVRACRALHGYSLTEATHCVEALTGADPT